MYKCKYFGIKEIVSKIVYNYYVVTLKYKESFLWSFFDEEILEDIDAVRYAWEVYVKEKYPKESAGIIINNWSSGGALSQCGLRTNADQLVKAKKNPYCSGHCLAKAFDLHPVNCRYKEFYNFCCNFIQAGKTKKLKRVENIKSTPTWCHLDGFRTEKNSLEVFNV